MIDATVGRQGLSVTPNLTVYFIHIPKTAGSTLLGQMGTSSHVPKMIRIKGRFSHYFRQDKSFNQEPSFVSGHNFYGIHYANPNHWFGQVPHTYVTVLRDPIERAISFYYYVKKPDRPAKYKHPFCDIANRVELKDFYRVLDRYDNLQTRMLSGYVSQFFEACNPFLLDQAKRNLERHFSVVGITEQYDETVRLINHLFGWQLDFDSKSRKVNPHRAKQNDLSEETLKALQDCHRFDLELYNFAKELFESSVAQNLG